MRVQLQLVLDVDQDDYLRHYGSFVDTEDLGDAVVDHVLECVSLGGNGTWQVTHAVQLHGFKAPSGGVQ